MSGAATGYDREYVPGEQLSPSQARSFLNCSARWAFKYYLSLPDPKSGAQLQGTAVHEAAAENFRQKLETREDLPAAGALAIFRDAWAAHRPEVDFRDDEDESELKAEGEQLTRQYLEDAAPGIQPAAVEMPVAGMIGGVRVRGYVDLLDTSGRVIDLKLKKRTPSGASFDEKFQLATYRTLAPAASGAGRVDVLVKKSKPELIQIDYAVTPAELTMVERLYPQVQAAIRGGVFTPNRGSNLCSRKYCPHWRVCEREFGGSVPE